MGVADGHAGARVIARALERLEVGVDGKRGSMGVADEGYLVPMVDDDAIRALALVLHLKRGLHRGLGTFDKTAVHALGERPHALHGAPLLLEPLPDGVTVKVHDGNEAVIILHRTYVVNVLATLAPLVALALGLLLERPHLAHGLTGELLSVTTPVNTPDYGLKRNRIHLCEGKHVAGDFERPGTFLPVEYLIQPLAVVGKAEPWLDAICLPLHACGNHAKRVRLVENDAGEHPVCRNIVLPAAIRHAEVTASLIDDNSHLAIVKDGNTCLIHKGARVLVTPVIPNRAGQPICLQEASEHTGEQLGRTGDLSHPVGTIDVFLLAPKVVDRKHGYDITHVPSSPLIARRAAALAPASVFVAQRNPVA